MLHPMEGTGVIARPELPTGDERLTLYGYVFVVKNNLLLAALRKEDCLLLSWDNR